MDFPATLGPHLTLLRVQLQPSLGLSAQKPNLVAAGFIACARDRHPSAELELLSLSELAYLRQRANAR
jgi:hypothetical protein